MILHGSTVLDLKVYWLADLFQFSLHLRVGFYQTGETSAVACDVFVVEEVSACGGGEACSAQRIGLMVPESCHGTKGTFDAVHRVGAASDLLHGTCSSCRGAGNAFPLVLRQQLFRRPASVLI